MQGHLYIISAPSGGGKTSLVKTLLERVAHIAVSISQTTRAPRPGEQNGVHYHFTDSDAFLAHAAQNLFLEYAHVFGHYYGTSLQWVSEKRQQGIDVILEIDWQGAQKVRERVPDAISIFILPPSKLVLKQRLAARAQDDPEVIAKRLNQASLEISHYYEYDYLIINDDFEAAVQDLIAIVRGVRLGCSEQAKRHQILLQELLAEPVNKA